MDKRKPKVPPNLVLTALLSGGITIVISTCYIVLCLIAIIYRYDCDLASPQETDNAQLTWHTVFRVYFQSETCENALPVVNITSSNSVFVMVTTTLCFSALTLIAGIFLTVVVKSEELAQYTNMFVFAYITCWTGSLAVDVTFGTHLGLDYTYLTNQLRDAAEYNFLIDALRHGAFILMAVALKGYVALAFNLLLILLLVIYSCDYQDASNREQHSIHKVGALNAFDQPRRDDNWVQPEPVSPYAAPFARGQLNNGYLNDDDHLRSLPRSEHYPSTSQSFNRSDSWQHQPQSSHGGAARPFSYLEEVRRPASAPMKPPVSPLTAPAPDWRRDYAPPVPAPDYSPHSPRRLKSALKPAYM